MKKADLLFRIVWSLCLITVFATGLFHLPLGRRYHVDSLPFLGWAGNIKEVVPLHHAAALAFLLCAVAAVLFWLTRDHHGELTCWGKIRAFLFLIMIASGVLLLLQESVAYSFFGWSYRIIKYSHLAGFMILLMGLPIMLVFGKSRWHKR